MFAVLYILVITIALLAQTSPLLATVGSGWRVDLALLVVVYLSLFWPGHRTLFLGCLTGLLQDALSSEILGLNALSKTLVVFVVQMLCRNVQVHSLLAQGLFTCLAILIDTLGRMSLLLILQLYAFDVRIILGALVQQIVLSLCLVPLVSYGVHTLANKLHVRQGKT
jgi:rod shape-determining protein MreD